LAPRCIAESYSDAYTRRCTSGRASRGPRGEAVTDDKHYALRALFKNAGLDLRITKGYPDWVPAKDRRLGETEDIYWVHRRGQLIHDKGLTFEEAYAVFKSQEKYDDVPPSSP
jgi:hypothetical protein